MRHLVELGADQTLATKDTAALAVHVAAERGDLEMVRFLIERGADTQAKKRNGATAVDLAAQHGHWEVVRFLAKFRTKTPPTKLPRSG